MKALEFISKIKNNRIDIPKGIQSELRINEDRDVRIIMLIDDSDSNEELIVKQEAAKYFLRGYADSDSVYEDL